MTEREREIQWTRQRLQDLRRSEFGNGGHTSRETCALELKLARLLAE